MHVPVWDPLLYSFPTVILLHPTTSFQLLSLSTHPSLHPVPLTSYPYINPAEVWGRGVGGREKDWEEMAWCMMHAQTRVTRRMPIRCPIIVRRPSFVSRGEERAGEELDGPDAGWCSEMIMLHHAVCILNIINISIVGNHRDSYFSHDPCMKPSLDLQLLLTGCPDDASSEKNGERGMYCGIRWGGGGWRTGWHYADCSSRTSLHEAKHEAEALIHPSVHQSVTCRWGPPLDTLLILLFLV